MNFLNQIPRIYFIAVCFFLFLLIGNDSPLYDQDEAAYAGFAKRMLVTQDFITQSFPFSEPHRKPPLHLWVSAFSFNLFGVSEFSLRIFPALWIALTCLFTFKIAKHIFSENVGEWSFLILATSLYFPLNGKIALVDGLLTFTQTLGFYALVKLAIPKDNRSSFWILLFWISVSLGALTKGPPILIFLGGICFICLFFSQTRPRVLQLRPWFFLPLALVPLFYWGYLAWQKTNGEMIRWMIDWYVLRRATDPVFGQSGPPGTYLLLFFITFFPWSIFLPYSAKHIWNNTKEIIAHLKDKKLSIDSSWILLLGGLIFGWIFYEILMSKLPSYPLAAYPILSTLIAYSISKTESPNLKKWILAIAILQTFVIHIFLAKYLNAKRSDTKILAESWNAMVPSHEPFYVLKNYALPSLAFYLDREISTKDSVQDYTNLKSDSYLAIDRDLYLLLSSLGLKAEILVPEKPVYEYDRNKTIELMLVKTKN